MTEEYLTQDNKQFIEEVFKDKMKVQTVMTSPLANSSTQLTPEWTPTTRRVGVIARKIGNYPIWSKDGKKMLSTLLQVHLAINLLAPSSTKWIMVMHAS